MRTGRTRRTSGGARESAAAPGQSPQIRILLADGDVLARTALRTALDDGRRVIVGQAADTPQAVSLATRCLPDVVLLDARLPPDGALAAIHGLTTAAPAALTIVLGQDDADAALQALAQGASGYLSRGIPLESLARAVDGAVAGEAAVSREVAGRLIAQLQDLSDRRSGMRPVKSLLTTREWEVLDLLKRGASTAEIATALVLSPDTVQSHVRHILRKLHAHSRAEAIEAADRADPEP